MDNNQHAKIILSVPNVQLCLIQNDLTQLLENSEMIFAQLENGQIIFTIGQHFYTLQKSVPIYLTAYETQRSYLYSFLGEIYSIILQNSTSSQFYNQINQIFDANAQLVVKDRLGKQFEDGGVEIKPPQPKEKSGWQMMTDGVTTVGSGLASGLLAGGKFMANGIVSVGSYIEQKITPGPPLQISDSTKSNVTMVKDASGRVLEVSGTVAKQIIEMNIQLAKMMANTVCEVTGMKKDQPQQSDPKNQQMKEFAESSIAATLNVLDALDKAASQVGAVFNKYVFYQAIGQTVTKIVEKKYGKDASDVFQEGVQVTENVGRTYKDVKSVEVKALARVAVQEGAKEVVIKKN